MSKKTVLLSSKRTPFGAFGGSLKAVSATDLGVHASRAALDATPGSRELVDHVIFGNVIQSSADAAYLSRHIGLKVQIAQSVPAVTVNRLCGSGFEAVAQAHALLMTGEAQLVLAGGAENMSACPYVVRSARFGSKAGHLEFEDSLMAGLHDSFAGMPMAMTAEALAEKYAISRAECDAFALQSQTRAAEATAKGLLAQEIAAFPEGGLSGDEHIRKDSTLEGLARLKPVFKKDGVVTAGNASGMVDGAAAVLVTQADFAASHRLEIAGEFLGSAVVGCDPKIMGIGPAPAIRKLCDKLSLKLDDFHLLEINEAFAAQTLAVAKELGIAPSRLNAEGGAISIGHPLGASGARLISHLLYALKRRGGGLGLASACIGGGQGIAVALRV